MSKQILILLIIFVASVCAFAQTEKYTAPVKWEKYKVSEKEFSILLPKLPTLTSGLNVCGQMETNKYTVYAENIVYGLNITVKSKQKIPGFCTNEKKFDKQNFGDRIKEIKSELNTQEETKFNQNGAEIVKIENDYFAYWLTNDFKNKRFYELWTTNPDETNGSIKNFVESFKIEKNPSGIEIGKGSNRILGDAASADQAETKGENSIGGDKENVKIRIVAKPRASYTDAARQANLQGTVRLRVTFLASGGIGSISILNALPYGLTEQAYAAAAKIAFIPAKKNGVPISIVSIVEYSFSIY